MNPKGWFEGRSAPETAAFVLLLFTLATAPVPWGGVTPGAAMRLTASAFVILALAMLAPADAADRGALLPALLLCGIALVGAIQLCAPFASLSPESVTAAQQANSVLAMYGRRTVAPRISLAPVETQQTILLILGYAAMFVATVRVASTRMARASILVTLAASAAVHVVAGAAWQWGRRPSEEAWLITGYEDRLHGAFVNPNHFAGYLELAFAAAFALLWREVQRRRRDVNPDVSARAELRFVAIGWRVLVWAVIAAGIGLTRSRMGVAAATVALVMMVGLAASHRTARRRARLLALLAVALLAGFVVVYAAASDVALLRFVTADPLDPSSDAQFRLRTWRTSLEAWQLFPHFGSGLGAFREAFRRVQPPDSSDLVEQAHCDALQLLVTGGWISLTLAALAFIALLAPLARRWWRQQHRDEAGVALAGLAGTICILLHGVAEFNFSMPAIPVTLAILAGTAWRAASGTSSDRARTPDRVTPISSA